MSMSVHAERRPGLLDRIAVWWRDLKFGRSALGELACCGSEVERIAHDVGVSGGELCILAGKWPASPDLLSRRMEEIKLDAADLARVEPQVMRDLQKTCSLCAGKRRCRRDLAAKPGDPAWQDYCPNTMTFAALLAERAASSGRSRTN